MTCKDCIHSEVCYRKDSVPFDYANKCGDYIQQPQDGDRAISLNAVKIALTNSTKTKDIKVSDMRAVFEVLDDLPSVEPQDDCDTECIYCKHCFEGSEFEPQEGDDLR